METTSWEKTAKSAFKTCERVARKVVAILVVAAKRILNRTAEVTAKMLPPSLAKHSKAISAVAWGYIILNLASAIPGMAGVMGILSQLLIKTLALIVIVMIGVKVASFLKSCACEVQDDTSEVDNPDSGS